MLPATARSKPPERNPPTMGTPLPIAYFAARRTIPSVVAAVIPCKVKNNPNTDTHTPIIHLFILLKKALNLLIFNSFVKFPAKEKAIIVIVSGKTTLDKTDTIEVEKKATAGRHTEAETAPPLAAINVNINGKRICICFCMEKMLAVADSKHSVNTPIKGINAAI